jgi:LysR family nitrogen assimilation transcriptional regulator
MNFKQLLYFTRVVDSGSFTKAAQSLHVAQPALGFQIKKLEEELEVELLVRHSRGVETTEAGEALLGRARSLLNELQSTKQFVQGLRGDIRGEVKLGMSYNLTMTTLIIKSALNEMSSVRLTVQESFARQVLQQIEDDTLDLGCIYHDPDNSRLKSHPRLAYDPLRDDELCLVGACSTIDPNKSTVRFRDLTKLPLVVPAKGFGIHKRLDAAAAAYDLQLNFAMENVSENLSRQLAAEGSFYAVKPYGMVESDVCSGRLKTLRIVNPNFRIQMVLVMRKDRVASRAVMAMAALIRRLAKQAAPCGPSRACNEPMTPS